MGFPLGVVLIFGGLCSVGIGFYRNIGLGIGLK